MGHRANFILVKDQETHCFTDRWSGIHIPNLTFWGPALTLQNLKLTDAVPVEFLRDSLWCEGAFLLHWDLKTLVFCFDYWSTDAEPVYGLQGQQYHWDIFTEFPVMLSCYMDLLQASWEGWTVKFASSVQFACPESLQLDPERIESRDLTDVSGHWLNCPLDQHSIYLRFAELLLKDHRFDVVTALEPLLEQPAGWQMASDLLKPSGASVSALERARVMRTVLQKVGVLAEEV